MCEHGSVDLGSKCGFPCGSGNLSVLYLDGSLPRIRDFALAVARRDHVLIEKSLDRVLKVSIQDLVPR